MEKRGVEVKRDGRDRKPEELWTVETGFFYLTALKGNVEGKGVDGASRGEGRMRVGVKRNGKARKHDAQRKG